MNVLESAFTVSPSGNSEECAKFIINTVEDLFILSDIANIGQTYTLSIWIKADTVGSFCVCNETVEITTEWKKYIFTFVAETKYVSFLFKTNGVYYMYHSQLELGNKATDWSPSPEDMASANDVNSLNDEILAVSKSVSSLTMTTDDIIMTVEKYKSDSDNALQSVDDNIESLNDEILAVSRSVSSLSMTADDIIMTVKQYKTDSDNALRSVGDSIESLSKSVSTMITAEDVKIEIDSAISNGTSKVITNTGFTFNDIGLTVEKSGREMKTQITEDGMTVYQNDQAVLTANNTGVDAKNLRATTYLIIGGRSRFENYGTNRTGCFWIGG